MKTIKSVEGDELDIMLMKHRFITIGIGINNGKIYYTAQIGNIVAIGYPLETAIENLELKYKEMYKRWING